MEGIYKLHNERIGMVKDFDPAKWYGHVTLDMMPEMAEYGTLEPGTTVVVQGKEYKQEVNK